DIPGRFIVTGAFQGHAKDLNIFLRPDSGAMMVGARGSIKDDGSFVITGVADDVYRLSVGQLAPNAYIKAAHYGSEDVLDKGFDPSGANESLEIVISGDGGRISGLVSDKDQKLQPGITVVAVPEHPIKWISERSKSTSTDQNGRFNLQGLRPGSY